MALYEMRKYTIHDGKLDEVVELYKSQGWPALEKEGLGGRPIGCFITDAGGYMQLVHIWRFDDEAARRSHWAKLFQDQDFLRFLGQVRPLLRMQEAQLLSEAPWGPHP